MVCKGRIEYLGIQSLARWLFFFVTFECANMLTSSLCLEMDQDRYKTITKSDLSSFYMYKERFKSNLYQSHFDGQEIEIDKLSQSLEFWAACFDFFKSSRNRSNANNIPLKQSQGWGPSPHVPWHPWASQVASPTVHPKSSPRPGTPPPQVYPKSCHHLLNRCGDCIRFCN